MTFSLRRKRQITARTWPTAGRKWTSLAGLLGLACGAVLTPWSWAQQPGSGFKLDPRLQRVVMQQQQDQPRSGDGGEPLSAQIQLTPPGGERIFGRLDT